MTGIEAAISGAAYAAVALLLGTLAIASFVLPAGEIPFRRALLSVAFFLLSAFLLVAVFSLAVQGAKLSDGNPPTVEILSRYLSRTQSGRIWLVREIYGSLLLLLLFRLQEAAKLERGCGWAFFLSLPLAAGRSLMSHAAAVNQDMLLAVSADAIHIVATALWAGGLPVLFWALQRGTKRRDLPIGWADKIVARFSHLALFSVVVIVLTGLYQSWIHVQSWSALFGSSYGKVLLLKLALFLLMAGLGAINFFSTRPGLVDAASDAPIWKKSLRRIGAESVLGFLILFVTGLLTVLPPGAHSQHQSFAPGAKTIQPAEGASVQILSPKNGEVIAGDRVPISFKLVGGKSGHHAHAYVDGELMGMFESRQGTLTGIGPGRHTLELRVVAADHQTELDASDKIEFMVK
jgi:putative copper resistance protein D